MIHTVEYTQVNPLALLILLAVSVIVLVRDRISEISIERSFSVPPSSAAESLDLGLPDGAVLFAKLQQIFGIEAGHVAEVHLAEDHGQLPALFRRRRRARRAVCRSPPRRG